ncbi:MAG: uracil-DNA glycosylase family protein [Pseudomonadota bacterium]
MANDLNAYLDRVRACRLCEGEMPEAPRPVLQASATARVLVVGQAPGNLARNSGKPFSDPSGVRLREWMGVDEATFYDASRVAVVPMGFCFPGYDAKGGDLPPMKRCAVEWRAGLLERLPNVGVTLLVGGYAQKWHLKQRARRSLTGTVLHWRDFAPEIFVTPHPSWRNNGWLKKHPWFEDELLPDLRAAVRSRLRSPS